MLSRFFCVAFATAVLGVFASSGNAQIFGQDGKNQKVDAEFVKQNMCLAAFAFPKAISQHKTMELLPREIITAWGQQTFGFDPLTISQIALLLEKPESMEQPPNYIIVLGFDEMQGLSENMLEEMDAGSFGGKTIYKNRQARLPSILVFDERTLIFGPDEYLRKSVASQSIKEGLATIIGQSRLKGEFRAFLDLESVRPLVKSQLDQIPKVFPPAIMQLMQLPDLINAIEIAVAIDEGFETKIVLHGLDDDAAGQLKTIIDDSLEFSKQMTLAQMHQQFGDPDDPIQVATIEYTNRVSEFFQAKLSPKVDGNQIQIQMQNEVAAIPVLIGMLLPAVQQTRSAARRVDGANRLRQFAIAMHNYHDVNKRLPARASFDENGRPLLSWRVHVLPYIEQNALFKQFHLDEPWDSPHNRQLIDKMPEIYVSPAVNLRPGRTVFLGIEGEGTVLGSDEGVSLQDIRDGSSNTALLVEADESMAQIWTKPADYKVDPNNPMRGLGGVHPAGVNVTFADGSVRNISSQINLETWKALLTMDGGEVIDRDF